MSRTDKLGITCGNCKTQGEVLGNAHTYQCPSCKLNYEATRCGKCHEAYLTDEPAWSTSQCPRCGFAEKRRTAAESTFSDFGDALTAPPSRVSAPSKVARTEVDVCAATESGGSRPVDHPAPTSDSADHSVGRLCCPRVGVLLSMGTCRRTHPIFVVRSRRPAVSPILLRAKWLMDSLAPSTTATWISWSSLGS